MRSLIVWGGAIIHRSKDYRVVVATTTKKRAAEILGVPTSYFNKWFCETSNQRELDVCRKNPEVLFVSGDRFNNEAEYITYEELKNAPKD